MLAFPTKGPAPFRCSVRRRRSSTNSNNANRHVTPLSQQRQTLRRAPAERERRFRLERSTFTNRTLDTFPVARRFSADRRADFPAFMGNLGEPRTAVSFIFSAVANAVSRRDSVPSIMSLELRTRGGLDGNNRASVPSARASICRDRLRLIERPRGVRKHSTLLARETALEGWSCYGDRRLRG